MTAPAIPTIHHHGTARHELEAKYLAAAEAVQTALLKVAVTQPQSCDYNSHDAYRLAAAEHRARMTALRTAHDELMTIHEVIEAQT